MFINVALYIFHRVIFYILHWDQVYKGLLTDGTVVAIRSSRVRRRHGVQTYTHQLELISKLRHCHLVSSMGHCFEFCQDNSTVTRIFHVFEYVPNGPLRLFISGKTGNKGPFSYLWLKNQNIV